MKVLSVVGTRPEIIRLSVILKKLDFFYEHIHVNTGQNFVDELNINFYDELELRKPDYILNSQKQITVGSIIDKVDLIIKKEKPDAFVCLGDTNSVISAYSAKKNKVPIFHLEAGNRCFDANVPEEINRKIVDSISDINLCYSSNAKNYLLNEGFPKDRIFVIGSPLREVINFYSKKIKPPQESSLKKFIKKPYLLVSFHRHESISNIKILNEFCDSIIKLSQDFNILITCHPKLKSALVSNDILLNSSSIFLSKPFPYFEYLYLLKNAKFVLSDSGTITEESSILGIKALNLRYTNERPEGFDQGFCPMVGVQYEKIIDGINILNNRSSKFYKDESIHDYRIKNTSESIITLILSYTQYIKRTVYYENL